MVSYLTADHGENRVLLPAEDKLDLSFLPNEVFLINGIPVVKLEEQDILVLHGRKLLSLSPEPEKPETLEYFPGDDSPVPF